MVVEISIVVVNTHDAIHSILTARCFERSRSVRTCSALTSFKHDNCSGVTGRARWTLDKWLLMVIALLGNTLVPIRVYLLHIRQVNDVLVDEVEQWRQVTHTGQGHFKLHGVELAQFRNLNDIKHLK